MVLVLAELKLELGLRALGLKKFGVEVKASTGKGWGELELGWELQRVRAGKGWGELELGRSRVGRVGVGKSWGLNSFGKG